MGETDHKAVFLDGTKLESRGGRHMFCPGKGKAESPDWIDHIRRSALAVGRSREDSICQLGSVICEIRVSCSRTHASSSSYPISPAATPRPVRNALSLVQFMRMQLTSRKVSITYIPMRLLPSTKAHVIPWQVPQMQVYTWSGLGQLQCQCARRL